MNSLRVDRNMATNPSAMVEKGVGIVIALVVTLLLVAFLLPVAINEIVDVETTDWSGGAASIMEIIDLIALLVIFLVMVGWAVTSYRSGRRGR